MIEPHIDLDKLQFKGARDFYNDVLGVLNQYELKTDQELCTLMSFKNVKVANVKIILDEMKKSNPNFDQLCNDVLEIQDSMFNPNWSQGSCKHKEVQCEGMFDGI